MKNKPLIWQSGVRNTTEETKEHYGGNDVRVGIHDAEKEHFKHKIFPNLAIMKISAYHKKNRDHVEWWNPLYRYDRVYSSKVFDFTPVDPYLPDDSVRGGTGYRDIPIDATLPNEIDSVFPDYSIYPECDYAIGYLTRDVRTTAGGVWYRGKKGILDLIGNGRRLSDMTRTS